MRTSRRQPSPYPAAFPRDPLLLLLLAGSLIACCWLLQRFLPALVGLGVIAMLTHTPMRRLRHKVTNKALAATIAVVCVTLCIIVPTGLAIHFLAQRILDALSLLRSPEVVDRIRSGYAALQGLLARHSIPVGNFDLGTTMDKASGPVGAAIASLLGGSVATITQLVLMLFLLFFWYRSGDVFVTRVSLLMPLSAAERRLLGGAMKRAVRAVLMGRVVVASIQALVAWIVFLVLQIPGASLLATVMFVCCILPAVGAFFVWVPVTVYLLLIHAWTRAIILGLIGTFVLSTVDNVLQAVIAGNQARMGTVEMLLTILGGVWVLGIPGLVLGPLVWVTAGGLLMIWNKRQRRSLEIQAGA